jgi:hypothetical protein
LEFTHTLQIYPILIHTKVVLTIWKISAIREVFTFGAHN